MPFPLSPGDELIFPSIPRQEFDRIADDPGQLDSHASAFRDLVAGLIVIGAHWLGQGIDLGADKHRDDPRQGCGRRRVDALDAGMRVRATNKREVTRARRLRNIVEKMAEAAQQSVILAPRHAAADVTLAAAFSHTVLLRACRRDAPIVRAGRGAGIPQRPDQPAPACGTQAWRTARATSAAFDGASVSRSSRAAVSRRR